MASRGRTAGGFTVTGPGLDDVRYVDPGPALSRALTAAVATPLDVTFYVRDALDNVVGYAERDGKQVFCVRH